MTLPKAYEINFDGIIGPTHNYSGLSFGNIASVKNYSLVSHPKEAALQGLHKMKYLSDLGLKQAVIPPHDRPHILTLRQLGFEGSESKIIEKSSRIAPELFRACCSASSMWTANAGTTSPSSDALDNKVHFTPANLINKFHRSIESSTTSRILKTIFSDSNHFIHHAPIPCSPYLGDEGAANHTRFCSDYSKPGIQLFVYGQVAFQAQKQSPKLFPARQTFEACTTLVRYHQLDSDQVVFAQQNPQAIDAGVFHNDVISVGNLNAFFFHEEAFLFQKEILAELTEKFKKVSQGQILQFIEVPSSKVSLKDAVSSYLFNSQLVMPPGETSMTLIAPQECQAINSVNQYLTELIHDQDSPIKQVAYFDLRQSMRNGGGPACLRFRVVLTEEELKKSSPGVFLDATLYQNLEQWIKKHYRDELMPDDLGDPHLLYESRRALDELTQILGLGSIYEFQR